VSVPNAVTLAKALRITLEKNQSNNYEVWRERFITLIRQYTEVEILAPTTGAPHILSIAFPYIKGEVAVNFFQENGIIISTSSACSSKSATVGHVVKAIGLSERYKNGVIRISLGQSNDEYDCKEFEKVFEQFIALLGRRKTNEME
jgi:cysteine desulfurase